MDWLSAFDDVGRLVAVWFILQTALLGVCALLDRAVKRFEFGRETMWRTALFGSAIAAVVFVVVRPQADVNSAAGVTKPALRLSELPADRRVEQAVALSTAPMVAETASSARGARAAGVDDRSRILGTLGLAAVVLGAFGTVRFGWRRARLSSGLRGAKLLSADQVRDLGVERLVERVGVRRSPAILGLDGLKSPIALGSIRPRIYWPSAASALGREAQSAALAHEFAHHRRRDPMWLGAALLVESLWFWSPLVRLARRRLVEVSEWSADRIAAEATDAVELAESLVTVASWANSGERTASIPACGMSVSTSGLSARVDRLLSRSVGGRKETRLLALAASITLSFTTTASLFSALAEVDGIEVETVSQLHSLSEQDADLPATAENLLDAIDVLEIECVTLRDGVDLLRAERAGDPAWSEVLSHLDRRLRDFEGRCQSLRARVRSHESHEPSDGPADRRERPQMEK